MNESAPISGLNLKLVEDAPVYELKADTPQEPNSEKAPGDLKGKEQREFLIKLPTSLFCDKDGSAYATVHVMLDGEVHAENHKLRSPAMERYFTKAYWETHKGVTTTQAQEDAFRVLEAKACSSGIIHEPQIRSAAHGGKIYIDLCTASWDVIEISERGYRVTTDCPVKFTRTSGMLPMIHPQSQPDALVSFRALLNLSDPSFDHQWVLILACLVTALHPLGPYPILVFIGEQGTGKSLAMKMMRRILDPSKAPIRSLPATEKDLILSALNSWVQAYDNLSGLNPAMCDALCRLATGSGTATRALYTNGEEFMIYVCRFIMLNGIDALTTRGDLLERSVIITLPVIEDHLRRTEQDVLQEFETLLPGIFDFLLNGLSAILRNLATTKLAKLPRMADFALKATAAEPAFGLSLGVFRRAYEANRAEAVEAGIEASPVAQIIREIVSKKNGRYVGTASDLFRLIQENADDDTKKSRQLPHGPKGVSDAMTRIAPMLRKIGIEVRRDRNRNDRLIILERVQETEANTKAPAMVQRSILQLASETSTNEAETIFNSEVTIMTSHDETTHHEPQKPLESDC